MLKESWDRRKERTFEEGPPATKCSGSEIMPTNDEMKEIVAEHSRSVLGWRIGFGGGRWGEALAL